MPRAQTGPLVAVSSNRKIFQNADLMVLMLRLFIGEVSPTYDIAGGMPSKEFKGCVNHVTD